MFWGGGSAGKEETCSLYIRSQLVIKRLDAEFASTINNSWRLLLKKEKYLSHNASRRSTTQDLWTPVSRCLAWCTWRSNWIKIRSCHLEVSCTSVNRGRWLLGRLRGGGCPLSHFWGTILAVHKKEDCSFFIHDNMKLTSCGIKLKWFYKRIFWKSQCYLSLSRSWWCY